MSLEITRLLIEVVGLRFILSMHPALNYRQSRRSACDRCRGFKLRCERDQVNGRSCERCLKAQVPCTTSVGQSVPNYLPTKSGAGSMPEDFGGRIPNNERMSMSMLHKTSMSKVRKPLGSSAMSRRHEHQNISGWMSADIFPYEFPVMGYPLGEDIGLQMPSQPALSSSFEQWNDQYSSWPKSIYQLVSETLLPPSSTANAASADSFRMIALGEWAVRFSIPECRTTHVPSNTRDEQHPSCSK